MKRNLWFTIILVSLSFLPSCSSGGGCPPTNVNGNGPYIIYNSQGQQQPHPETPVNGQIKIPCGGSAHPTSGGPAVNQQ